MRVPKTAKFRPQLNCEQDPIDRFNRQKNYARVLVESIRCAQVTMLLSLVLLFCPGAKSAQQCVPDDVAALSKVGYSSQQVASICKVAAAFFGSSGRVDLKAGAVARFIDSITPIEIDGTDSKKFWLRELKYCKADNEHRAELIAYGQTARSEVDTAPPTMSSGRLESSDCDQPLLSVSKRVINKTVEGGLQDFVARATLDWAPWELTLSVTQIIGSAKSVPGTATFPTNVIPANLGNQVIPFSAAFYFKNDSITVILVPSTEVAAIADLASIPRLSSFEAIQDVGNVASEDARISVTHRAVNYVLETYFSGGQSLTVETGNQAIGNLTVTRLHGDSSGSNQYTASGVVLDSNKGSYAAKVITDGSDLAISQIEITPNNLQICPAPTLADLKSIQCNAANAAMQAGGALLGSVVTVAYKGSLLRSFGTLDTVRITLGRISCDVSTVVRNVSSTDRYLRVDVGLAFRHPL